MAENEIGPAAFARVDELMNEARAELAKGAFGLPPVADARSAGRLTALCDELERRIREAERLAHPLHEPHRGRFIFWQRVVRRLMRPTLEHQERFNAATIACLRAEAEALHALVAALHPAAEKEKP
jgi:hypothetical protein